MVGIRFDHKALVFFDGERKHPLEMIIPESLVKLSYCGTIERLREKIEIEPLTFIVIDLSLRENDPIEVAVFIRSHQKFHSIPILFSGDRLRPEMVDFEGFDRGHIDFLKRPFRTSEVLFKVNILRSLKESRTDLIQNAKLASIGHLAAGVAHEINNPLAIALGNWNYIQRIMPASIQTQFPELKVRFEKIRCALNRITEIVDGLQTFARKDGDNKEVVAVSQVIRRSVKLVADIFAKTGVILEFHDLNPSLNIIGRRSELQQIVFSLLQNGRDAVRDKAHGKILMTVQEVDSHAVISVTDNGCGIPVEVQDRIFDAFFTTKSVGSGTGLGLAVVSELVEDLGGKISVCSEVGVGTTFKIMIPLCVQSPHLMGGHEEVDPPLKAVVVVGESEMREVLASILKDNGFACMAFENGDEALNLVSQSSCHLVLSEVRSGRKRKPDLLENIHSLNLDPKPYLVAMMLGKGDEDSKEPNEMADHYLFRPYQEEKILEVVRIIKGREVALHS